MKENVSGCFFLNTVYVWLRLTTNKPVLNEYDDDNTPVFCCQNGKYFYCLIGSQIIISKFPRCGLDGVLNTGMVFKNAISYWDRRANYIMMR